MTARFLDPESRRRLLYAAVAPVLVMVAVLLAAGCAGQKNTENNTIADQTKNISLEHADYQVNSQSLFNGPIGGFDQTFAVLKPNTTFETDYTFYSRNWGPGEVHYSLNVWYMNGSYVNKTYWCCPFLLNQTEIHIEPSSFFAEPNRTYHSKISLITSSLPPEYFTGIHSSNGNVHYSVRLNIEARAGNSSSQNTADQITFVSRYGGPMTYDRISTENCSVLMKRGETRNFSFTFQHDVYSGIGEITFVPQPALLNVTITPSSFIAKPSIEFPFTVVISADRTLAPGNYPFIITINGATSPNMIHCLDSDTTISPQNAIRQSYFPVNVTVV